MNFDRFYLYDEVKEYVESLQKSYPSYVKLKSLYTTESGKEIFLLTLMDFESRIEEEMPAYYVQAGVHAKECGAVTAALKFAYELLKSPEMLKERVYYIIPMSNPENMDTVMKSNMPIRSKFKEKLFNGITPMDINGDGRVMNMRIKNPHGNMKKHPEFPEVMIPREPGETEGEFYDLTFEGIFENDSNSIEDISYVNFDFNRNYPSSDWEARSHTGRISLSEPENRAIVDFISSHRNIFAAIDLHCGQNAVIRTAVRKDSEFPREDLMLMKGIGALGEEITGFPLLREDEYAGGGAWSVAGNFNSFAYDNLGISSYVIEMGNGFNDAGYPTLEYLKYPDKCFMFKDVLKTNPDCFVPWEKFSHPQLGEVEIGGFIEGRAYYMKPSTMEKVCPKTANFMMKHSSMGPVLDIDNVETVKISEDVFRIRCSVMNTGRMSTNVMKGTDSFYSKWNVSTSLESDEPFEMISKIKTFNKSSLAPLEREEYEWFVRTGNISGLSIVSKHPKAVNAYYKL